MKAFMKASQDFMLTFFMKEPIIELRPSSIPQISLR